MLRLMLLLLRLLLLLLPADVAAPGAVLLGLLLLVLLMLNLLVPSLLHMPVLPLVLQPLRPSMPMLLMAFLQLVLPVRAVCHCFTFRTNSNILLVTIMAASAMSKRRVAANASTVRTLVVAIVMFQSLVIPMVM